MMDHFYWLQPLANIKPKYIYIYILYDFQKQDCIMYTPPIHHNPNYQKDKRNPYIVKST